VTTSGYVRNINTTGTPYGETWADGDTIWVSKATAGAITNIEPSAPHHSDRIGSVVNAHATQGSILVSIDRYQTLESLSDINGTALATSGQIPNWNNATGYFDFDKNINDYLTEADFADIKRQGLVDRAETTIAFDGTNTFTLTSVGASWSYYREGYKYTITGNKTVVIP
jgi:hypothetical protein